MALIHNRTMGLCLSKGICHAFPFPNYDPPIYFNTDFVK
jgi:hypothetical protein